ncbi:MAG TPA: hypothetical protein VF912_05120 [Anaeromyxobacter sp.]
MAERTGRDERGEVERELGKEETDEKRQRRGSTPAERVVERALDLEPGVEQHAGEDAGQVPRDDDDASDRDVT